MHLVLEELVTAKPAPRPIDSLATWWTRHRELSARFPVPVDVAILAGFAADRLGYAFASGYQAAGAELFAGRVVGEPRLSALCVTEAGGAHPRAIATTLRRGEHGLRLDGEKRFVTLGPAAERLFVVASEGLLPDGKNRLRVAAIDARRAGVTLRTEATAFVPEIPHAVATFDGVTVADDELLAGDGYLEFVKPFRTVEDCHVHAALLGWWVQLARRADASHDLLEALFARVVTMRALALADPKSAAVHLALGGALASARQLLAELEPLVARLDAETRTRFERDRPLLKVAGRARELRREAAWRTLSG